jgi:hypothetical protein
MGDRTWTSIQFSGVIDREKVPLLIEAIEAEAMQCDNGPEGAIADAHLIHMFYDEECNYATLESVEAVCKQIGISYLKSWEPGGGYVPGMEIYNAVVDQTFSVGSLEGEPVVTLADLKKRPVEETIAYLESFANFEKNYPPLEIREPE